METVRTTAQRFLENLQRYDLAMLVSRCDLSQEGFEFVNVWGQSDYAEPACVDAPSPIDEALKALPEHDRKRIAEAIASAYPNKTAETDISIRAIDGRVEAGAPALLAELLIHRAMMISVATGSTRIQEADDYYRAREARLRQKLPPEVGYSNPHSDLWDWYHYWGQHFPSYRERRQYVRQMFGPAIDAVARRPALPSEPREPTGWERVDRAMATARADFETAKAEEDWQAVALKCREVMISLGQAVFDAEKHPTLDGKVASSTDAKRMLEAYIAHELRGSSHEEVRAHAKASLALALHLQHRRTATAKLAALRIVATASTTATISILARPAD